MRVFVPMSDDWMDDPQFALDALVPYRCGMRLPHAGRQAQTHVGSEPLREDCGGLAVWGEPDNPPFSRAA
jgi:hypothetical protein